MTNVVKVVNDHKSYNREKLNSKYTLNLNCVLKCAMNKIKRPLKKRKSKFKKKKSQSTNNYNSIIDDTI